MKERNDLISISAILVSTNSYKVCWILLFSSIFYEYDLESFIDCLSTCDNSIPLTIPFHQKGNIFKQINFYPFFFVISKQYSFAYTYIWKVSCLVCFCDTKGLIFFIIILKSMIIFIKTDIEQKNTNSFIIVINS